MAVPRVFVSSTCYDFREVRQTLRDFISGFGYEPVMSEFGDIFYDYNKHVQDGCLSEIEKCNLFILIVGNHYGNFYHTQRKGMTVPDSVTLKEFRKALSVNIPKHMFVNRFVYYDYTNYRRQLEELLTEVFDKNDVPVDQTEATVKTVRDRFDMTYSFPNVNYRYIFYFIDLITELRANNAVFEFERVFDIQDQLRKQWAGFMYEKLTHAETHSTQAMEEVSQKLDRIESVLTRIVSHGVENRGLGTLDIDKMAEHLVEDSLKKGQDLLLSCLNEIMYMDSDRQYSRGHLKGDIDGKGVTVWLDSLTNLVKKYKWAKTVPFRIVFAPFDSLWIDGDQEISYETLVTLHGLWEDIGPSEKESFSESAALTLRSIFENDEDVPLTDDNEYVREPEDDDDVPL